MLNTRTVLRAFLIVTLSNILLIGCGGGDAPADSTTGTTTSSNWDQMEWDKGTWSN